MALFAAVHAPVARAAEATFADLRNYIYHGQKIDQQVHLGYDLAVTQHVGVEASNDGKVVYAAPLGIYGNCIVVDHGYGLQTIYGHLSRIDVHEGDMVKRGQAMGLSGMTGMAGGDHVHFAMQLDGVQIDPKEWWDPHWIQDHIARRVDLPGFNAAAASTPAAAPQKLPRTTSGTERPEQKWSWVPRPSSARARSAGYPHQLLRLVPRAQDRHPRYASAHHRHFIAAVQARADLAILEDLVR